MMNTTKIFKTAALVGALAAGSAFSLQASAVTVDFAGNAWMGQVPGGDRGNTLEQSIAVGGVTVSSLPGGTTTLFWDNHDGLGVTGPADGDSYDDEIDVHDGDGTTFEQIAIHFDTAIDITGFTVSDFFNLTGLNDGNEVGQVSFNGGAFIDFISNVAQAGDPTQFVAIGATGVTDILFQAGDFASDFSIASLETTDVAAVPLPPAVWLLGSAMVFLFRKRDATTS